MVDEYLKAAARLIKSGEVSDGCTVIFASFIYKFLNNAKNICILHDLGARDLIRDVRPGWHNNFIFLKANWSHGNYVWGVVSYFATLPYAVVRYNFGVNIGVAPFHGFLFFLSIVSVFFLVGNF